jgi:hypothetical protein
MEKKKLLFIGEVLEPTETYTNFGHYGDTEFEFVSARCLQDAFGEIAKTKKPIVGIVFARSILVENYSKDKGNIVSMLVVHTAKQQYPKLKVVSMVFNDLDTIGKAAAIVGSYVTDKSDWRKIDEFISSSG